MDGRRRARGALQNAASGQLHPCLRARTRPEFEFSRETAPPPRAKDETTTHGCARRTTAATPPRRPTNTSTKTQVAALEAKWQEPRWKGVERPYSAQDVVAMRGTLQGEAPYQDATAQKLFETLDLCATTGGHSRTYGALDPVQAATMAPKLTSIYVSGWQCSSTSSSSNEPGPDFADYPYDTVPKKVDQLFKALKHHDRRAFSSGQDVDYLTPIVADGDTGHGGLTAVMKLTQLMVEAGAAGVHFEDQSVFRVVIGLRLGVFGDRRGDGVDGATRREARRSRRRRRRGVIDAVDAARRRPGAVDAVAALATLSTPSPRSRAPLDTHPRITPSTRSRSRYDAIENAIDASPRLTPRSAQVSGHEEVRPHGRQGLSPDARARRPPQRGAPPVRRHGLVDPHHRAHGPVHKS
jgi:hypothetical protein